MSRMKLCVCDGEIVGFRLRSTHEGGALPVNHWSDGDDRRLWNHEILTTAMDEAVLHRPQQVHYIDLDKENSTTM